MHKIALASTTESCMPTTQGCEWMWKYFTLAPGTPSKYNTATGEVNFGDYCHINCVFRSTYRLAATQPNTHPTDAFPFRPSEVNQACRRVRLTLRAPVSGANSNIHIEPCTASRARKRKRLEFRLICNCVCTKLHIVFRTAYLRNDIWSPDLACRRRRLLYILVYSMRHTFHCAA